MATSACDAVTAEEEDSAATAAVGCDVFLPLPLCEEALLLPLEEVERRYILHVMQCVGGNRTLAARRLGLALSAANPPAQSAAWVDGFLRNSGVLLLHDETLWRVLDDWVTALSPDHFTAALPLLRRTFGTFQIAERRQLGTRVASGTSRVPSPAAPPAGFDEARANRALPLLAQLLGLKLEIKP